jgi:hypothetical protein
MKKFVYIYKGEIEVELPGYGMVKPGDKIESPEIINHPLFEAVEDKKEKSAK